MMTVGQCVAVIGAGNTAIDAATAARRLGAKEIHILYRRGEHEMPAFEYEFEIAKLDRVEFHWWTEVKRITGAGHVQGIDCVQGGANFHLACDMVIPAIGQGRLVDFLALCRDVAGGWRPCCGRARIGSDHQSEIFRRRRLREWRREVVDAVADGKRAGIGIARHLGL
jgi:glutamate synthase (NADPH/NADH) small chain